MRSEWIYEESRYVVTGLPHLPPPDGFQGCFRTQEGGLTAVEHGDEL